MKTLILYASKYGATEEIAKRIGKKMQDAVVFSLKQQKLPNLSEFDQIVIGSAIYAGSIRKEAKAFIAANLDELLSKPCALFLSGISEDSASFERNFPPKLLTHVKAKDILGGAFEPKKAGAIERFIIKIVTKQAGPINRIDDTKISLFVDAISK